MLVLWGHIKIVFEFFFFFSQVVFPLFQGVFVDVRCVYDMYMVLFKPSWPFLRGNFGDKLLLDMYIFPLATCYHWNQRGKVILFLCYKQDTLKKTQKNQDTLLEKKGVTKEKGNCGLAREGTLLCFLKAKHSWGGGWLL